MMGSKSILKQYNVGKWAGGLKSQAGSAQFYVSIVQLTLVAVAAIEKLQQWLPWCSFPILMGCIVMIYLLAMLFDFKFVLPSIVSFNNEQWYKHNNPVKLELEEIKKQLEELLKEKK